MSTSKANPFDNIYTKGLWGQKFYSGPGSHWPPLINAYVDCVKNFLRTETKSSANVILDIGCGDFNIGRHFMDDCNTYIAIDTSSQIIKENQKNYKYPRLTFTHLDASTDELPKGNIIFLRQVLQHLNNQKIQELLDKLQSKNSHWLILTEHVPAGEYEPNKEHLGTQDQTRLQINSGVKIEKKPFNFQYSQKITLLSYYGFGGIIETFAYRI